MILYLLPILDNALKMWRQYLKLLTFKTISIEMEYFHHSVYKSFVLNISSHIITPITVKVIRTDYKKHKTTRWYTDVVFNISEIYC